MEKQCVYCNWKTAGEQQYYFNFTHLSLWQLFEAYHQICLPKQHPGLFVPARRRHAGQACLVALHCRDLKQLNKYQPTIPSS